MIAFRLCSELIALIGWRVEDSNSVGLMHLGEDVGFTSALTPKEVLRIEICHEPDLTICGCGCALRQIGDDVSEKLDYLPRVMQVERHIPGK